MPKVGDKIRIIKMDGEPRYGGRVGVIQEIDEDGWIWGDLGLLSLNS